MALSTKQLYTFEDSSFYNAMIEKAEALEKKRYADLYNHVFMKDKKWLTVDELLKLTEERKRNWKDVYVNILDGNYMKEIESNNTDLMDEFTNMIGDLVAKVASSDIAVEIAKIAVEDAWNGKGNISDAETDLKIKQAIYEGNKQEEDSVTHRFKQIKGIDIDATFDSSTGQWQADLKGDYAFGFSGSKMRHWGEVKKSLDKFHITGSKSKLFLEPLIKTSRIERQGDTLVITFTSNGVDTIARKFLTRKFADQGVYPVYEDGHTTVLCSEMLKAFAEDGVQLYQQPASLVPEKEVVEKYNDNTRKGLESIVRNTFNRRQAHFDMWYGNAS